MEKTYRVFHRNDPEGDQDNYRDAGRALGRGETPADCLADAKRRWAGAGNPAGEYYLVPSAGFKAGRLVTQ